jgi:hypothetical protein
MSHEHNATLTRSVEIKIVMSYVGLRSRHETIHSSSQLYNLQTLHILALSTHLNFCLQSRLFPGYRKRVLRFLHLRATCLIL